MEKLDGMSLNVEQVEIDKLRAVFPQCFNEGKLDLTKLLAMLGQYDDNDFEKYKFEWKGKSESLRLAQTRSMGTLRPVPEESVDWDTTQNVYIEGDNLEVLKLLQTDYYRRVKMIYIDPPYNTGNDFVYNDDFKDPLSRYKEVTSQTTKSNPETMGRFHTAWLNMMYPRLRLASNLLADDGVIFISIDDNEVYNLKKVCDEVFGEENYLGCFTVSSNPRGRQSDTFFATVHDYMLIYAKNHNECLIAGLSLSDEQRKEYNLEDSSGEPYRLLGLRQRGSASRRVDRPDMYFPIYVDKATEKIYLEEHENCHIVLPRKSDGTDGRWMWGKDKCKNETDRLVARLIAHRNEYDIFIKDYLNKNDEERTRKAKTVWDDKFCNNQFGTQEVKALLQGDFMSYPKSMELIKNICKLGSRKNNDDIILDFFSGSGTTAHAVMQLNAEDGGNRKFIMVQLPEVTDEKSEANKAGFKNICEIGEERIRRAGKKIKDEWQATQAKRIEDLFAGQEEPQSPPDTGFKVFRLDTSNLKTWDSTPVDKHDATQMDLLLDRMNDMIDTIKNDRTDLDIVYEVILKMGGVDLTAPVREVEVGGKRAYTIGENSEMLLCLQEGLSAEVIERMADEFRPSKMILSEKCFTDDTAMANAHYILKERGVELKLV
jgi:adenine-specific DNA-methyltransferase